MNKSFRRERSVDVSTKEISPRLNYNRAVSDTNCEYVPYEVIPKAYHYKINLKHGLEYIEDYQEIISIIEATTDMDMIDIHLETDGGSLQIGLQIVDALCASDSYKRLFVHGGTASMGTMIALGVYYDEYHVDPLSTWLFHSVSYGYQGKQQDMKEYVDHTEKLCTRIYERFYKGILSEETVHSMVEGKSEVFMLGEEVMELLTKAKGLAIDQQEEESLEDILTYDQLMKLSKKDILEYFGVEKPEENTSEKVLTQEE